MEHVLHGARHFVEQVVGWKWVEILLRIFVGSDTKLSRPDQRDVTNNRISTNIQIQIEDTIEFEVRIQQKQGGEALEQEVRNQSNR